MPSTAFGSAIWSRGYLRFEVSRESVDRAWELLREIP